MMLESCYFFFTFLGHSILQSKVGKVICQVHLISLAVPIENLILIKRLKSW
jgi:hypothetical protein